MKKQILTRFMLVSLVFSILSFSCRSDKRGEELNIHFKGSKAVALVITKKLAGGIDKDKIQVFLSSSDVPMLGEFNVEDERILFYPVIPFTHGLTYKVTANGKVIGEIEIPVNVVLAVPDVVAVYPTVDTVPENLLKMYIEFSNPMKEGEALKHLALVKNGKDTLSAIFLDLQPELWNNDRTVLTVWFDPGRIKRDLQPNLTMGAPLTKGNKYSLVINKEWVDVDGMALLKGFTQDFVVADRDSNSPEPVGWEISIPKAGSVRTLQINFNESLDYLVLMNAIHLVDSSGNKVPCRRIFATTNETGIGFQPKLPWKKGDYYLIVESKLEDLAGNNLDHPFDNDITMKQNKNSGKNYKKLIRII